MSIVFKFIKFIYPRKKLIRTTAKKVFTEKTHGSDITVVENGVKKGLNPRCQVKTNYIAYSLDFMGDL